MLPPRIGRLLAALTLVLLAGCGRDAPTPVATTRPGVRVASLVPAVTNLLLGVGERDALAAVSNYDIDPRVADLPRVGDLLSVDWEQIAAARPTLIVVQINPDKLPPELGRRAAELGVELVNVRLNTLDDIGQTLATLQAKIDPGGESWRERFDARLDAVRARVAGLPKVSTLLALKPDATFVAGPGGYLDDLLALAGGANALPPDSPPYPTLDRERLLSLRPAKVFMILSDSNEGTFDQAERFARDLPPQWPARRGDVSWTGDPYALVPGWGVLDLADEIAGAIHPPSGEPRHDVP